MPLRRSELLFYLIILLFFIIPISFLVFQSLEFRSNPTMLLLLYRAVYQSLLQASLSTGIAFILGLVINILLLFYSGKLVNIMVSVLYITFVMPGIIVALAIISILGLRYPLYEIIWGNVIFNAPMIGVIGYSYSFNTNPREIQMARILGANDGGILKLYLRNSIKGLMLGSLISFVLCFQGFSLPLILGGPKYSTVEVLIYLLKRVYLTTGLYPFSGAAFVSIIQFIILLFPIITYFLMFKSTSTTMPYRFNPFSRKKSTGALVALTIIIIVIYYPLLNLFFKYPLYSSGHLNNVISPVTFRAITNTILFSIITILVSLFLVIMVLSMGNQLRSNIIFALSMALTPVALALSYFLIYNAFLPLPVIIILIFVAISLPLLSRNFVDSLKMVPKSERFSPLILGDTPVMATLFYYFRRIKGNIISVIALEFVTIMGEFSAIATVYSGNTETLTVEIYNEFLLRRISSAYVLAELFTIVIFISTFLIYLLGMSGYSVLRVKGREDY